MIDGSVEQTTDKPATTAGANKADTTGPDDDPHPHPRSVDLRHHPPLPGPHPAGPLRGDLPPHPLAGDTPTTAHLERSRRLGCVAADPIIGAVLLPEYMWTRSRRTRGQAPGMLAVTAGPVAERALVRCGRNLRGHGHITATGPPPLIRAAIFCVASLGLHWLMLRPGPGIHGMPQIAVKVWGCWSSFNQWNQSGCCSLAVAFSPRTLFALIQRAHGDVLTCDGKIR